MRKSSKFYDKLLSLNNFCFLDGVYKYIKSSIVRAFIEASLSLFVLESLMIYSNLFRVSSMKITAHEMYILILAPILITIISCGLYSFIIAKNFLNELLKCSQQLSNDNGNSFVEIDYAKVDNHFRLVFRKTHLWGAFFYFATSCIIDLICIYNNIIQFPISIIVGTLSGLLWNYQDFCVDQSLKWHKFYRVLDKTKIKESRQIQKEKITHHILYNIYHVIILILIVVVFVIILINPHPALTVELKLDDLDVLTMSFLVVASITLTSFYIRNVLKLHYSKEGANKIYFTIHDIIKDTESNIPGDD